MVAQPVVNYEMAVEWDVATWRRALRYWESQIDQHGIPIRHGLELGARHGGLTYFFCKRYGTHMECTDRGMPTERARTLHSSEGVSALVEYRDVDATQLPYDDDQFDFVTFKSILGAIGACGQMSRICGVLSEVRRVLKPNGAVFFAENLRGSRLHQLGRQLFVPWGRSWHYLTVRELSDCFRSFASHTIQTTGCLAAFAPSTGRVRNGLAAIDAACQFLPDRWHYVGYGVARK